MFDVPYFLTRGDMPILNSTCDPSNIPVVLAKG
jgi:hypothetical protein